MYELQVTVTFPSVVPVRLVDLAGMILGVAVVVGLLFVFWRLGPTLKLTYLQRESEVSHPRFGLILVNLVNELGYQRTVFTCNRAFWLAHLAAFWGFVCLGVSTTLGFIYNQSGGPLPITHPVRIFGNVGGGLLLVGLSYIILRRTFDPMLRRDSKRSNVLFLGALYLATWTGFLTELSAYTGYYGAVFLAYVSHLSFVVALLALSPFIKFIHAIGRPLLVILEKHRDELSGTVSAHESEPPR